jgi:nucleotide-binding universal stress UspA family protein
MRARRELMYGKILVAYDGAGSSDAALHQAADLARLCNAELHVMSIVLTTGYASLAEGMSGVDVWGMERKSLQQALDAAGDELGKQGVNVFTCIREGDPAIEIVAHAIEIRSDLVVLGHTGKGLFASWFEGSTGSDLLRDLPCSLLIAVGKV